MSKKTGGYAFPIPNADFQTFQPETVDEYKRIQSGMTLRDYFAAKSLAVAWSALEGGYFEADADTASQRMAECAYQLADAMLAARGSND